MSKIFCFLNAACFSKRRKRTVKIFFFASLKDFYKSRTGGFASYGRNVIEAFFNGRNRNVIRVCKNFDGIIFKTVVFLLCKIVKNPALYFV